MCSLLLRNVQFTAVIRTCRNPGSPEGVVAYLARGFDSPLPGFDQHIAVAGAVAEQVSWASHVEEFREVRLATLAFFRNLPAEAWMRSGIASGNPFTVRALAYLTSGHVAHHTTILRERYL